MANNIAFLFIVTPCILLGMQHVRPQSFNY
jgi:hypothetical protein